MNKRNMTGHKQILAEISKARDAFTELDDLFLKADENIANDPDDLREGIGRFPGLDRLMLLIPCVINRLEEDISNKSKEIADVVPIVEGLRAIKEGVNSVLTYYLQDDDEYEVRTVDLRYEEKEEPEPWAGSLPELRDWNKHASESSFDDSELLRQDFEDDPVYRLLKPFTNNVFECLKRDYLKRVKESGSEENQMRSPLEHYLVILALKPQVRLSSCGVLAEDVGHEAPRKGVYMFTMEYLDRIVDAIEKFSLKHLYHLDAEARNIREQIEEILT